jgi:exonuclease III
VRSLTAGVINSAAATMQIISWNVASWQTTLAQIRIQHGSLSQYLDMLQCDILCVQETKLTRDKLSTPKVRNGSVCPAKPYADGDGNQSCLSRHSNMMRQSMGGTRSGRVAEP